jgi:hypothetical protein
LKVRRARVATASRGADWARATLWRELTPSIEVEGWVQEQLATVGAESSRVRRLGAVCQALLGRSDAAKRLAGTLPEGPGIQRLRARLEAYARASEEHAERTARLAADEARLQPDELLLPEREQQVLWSATELERARVQLLSSLFDRER